MPMAFRDLNFSTKIIDFITEELYINNTSLTSSSAFSISFDLYLLVLHFPTQVDLPVCYGKVCHFENLFITYEITIFRRQVVACVGVEVRFAANFFSSARRSLKGM